MKSPSSIVLSDQRLASVGADLTGPVRAVAMDSRDTSADALMGQALVVFGEIFARGGDAGEALAEAEAWLTCHDEIRRRGPLGFVEDGELYKPLDSRRI